MVKNIDLKNHPFEVRGTLGLYHKAHEYISVKTAFLINEC